MASSAHVGSEFRAPEEERDQFRAGGDLSLASAALLEAADYPPSVQGGVADLPQKDLHGAQDRVKEVSMYRSSPEYMLGYSHGVMLTLALVMMMFMALLLAMSDGVGPTIPFPPHVLCACASPRKCRCNTSRFVLPRRRPTGSMRGDNGLQGSADGHGMPFTG
ncbi:MAG: hypothetical protein IPM54_10225 [Polyangiaceae bacterium]|nr:hypothetical protein [Polyangiaceae bacterium]